jgi:SAM-dependent methyltransferase
MNRHSTLTLALALFSIGLAAQDQRPARAPDVNFVPTRQADSDAMLKMAKVTSSDVVYDLGSGDGRIVILAAQKYGARAVGIELDPQLVEMSRQIAREGEVADRATFRVGDIFAADISDATVVTLYLSTSINARLEPKLRQLRPGTRIVSHQFPIGSWPPEETVQAADGTNLFLWTVPEPTAASSELTALIAKAKLDRPVALSCRGEFRTGRAGAFAVAVTSATGAGGQYLVLDPDGTVSLLAAFSEGPDLACYTRAAAEQLNDSIARARTVHGSVNPPWDTTIVCGFVEDTRSVCWQFSPAENRFVTIGEWIT